MAFAAPVDVGMMLIAAARARRRSLCGRSRIDWSFVYAWIVVMNAISRPNASSSTLAIGATQLVVQDAFEMTLCLVPPWMEPTVTTAGSVGSISRLTSVCK